ncbi:MAG: DUF3160 domain-containing protein [Lachnospiraceae bacterium]|nr:DUF3160 domain-containing protein [Lachnospiraceae bacterium]
MFCPNCGAPNANTAKFCASCGNPIPQITSGNIRPEEPSSPSGRPRPDSPSRPVPQGRPMPSGGGTQPPKPSFWSQIPLFAKILIPVLAVIALALIGILLFYRQKNPGTPPDTAENVTTDSTAAVPDAGTPAAGTGDGGQASQLPAEILPGTAAAEVTDENGVTQVVTVEALPRPSFLNGLRFLGTTGSETPQVPSYQVAPDLSNIDNNDLYMSEEQTAALLANNFFISAESGGYEFFDTYEMNRYMQRPSFVTTDSMMHVYHLYFSHLMKNTERKYLSSSLGQLASGMLAKSAAQLETLRGTEWENAAVMNTAFFAVGAALLEQPVQIPQDVSEIAQKELALINDSAAVDISPLMNFYGPSPEVYEDYSQYIVRGYYEGDAQLEKYFRAMMWFGRMNFLQSDETTDRAALLMTLSLDDETRPLWEAIYSVTSFFAGASDDSGYYEYRPIIDSAYGASVTAADLPGNEDAWAQYHALTATMNPPKINSVPMIDNGDGANRMDQNKGYRFMGQRFSIDATVFQNLLYNRVGSNSSGQNRMLPDALDIPAAFGSDAALSILDSRGNNDYDGYSENMTNLRSAVLELPDDMWNASLYSKWLDTLRPLLTEKGEGYPTFMQSSAWTRKNLQTFLGSYAELKHDTVLYSKQVMVEMGGDDFGVKDDRGYVEPEPLLFGKLADLTQATADGLSSYGLLDSEDADNLSRLAQLADQLRVIAEKELRNELPTDEEFDLIRTYGGQLEHFWEEVYKHESTSERFTSRDFPAAIVTDVATDPNGSCLELGTGKTGTIYVVVPLDGSLRIATGTVYSFYQFQHPLSDRLTDSKWRLMMGIEMNDAGNYNDPAYRTEDWTEDFTLYWRDYN